MCDNTESLGEEGSHTEINTKSEGDSGENPAMETSTEEKQGIKSNLTSITSDDSLYDTSSSSHGVTSSLPTTAISPPPNATPTTPPAPVACHYCSGPSDVEDISQVLPPIRDFDSMLEKE
ncbi:hypothetical protein Dimus_000929 [Dionaea muscipula]